MKITALALLSSLTASLVSLVFAEDTTTPSDRLDLRGDRINARLDQRVKQQ